MNRDIEDIYDARRKRREIFDEIAKQLFLGMKEQISLSEIKKSLRKSLSKVYVELEINDPLEVCKAICDLQLQERYTQRLVFEQLVFGLCASFCFRHSTEDTRNFIRLAIHQGLPLPNIFDMNEIASAVMKLRNKYLEQNG